MNTWEQKPEPSNTWNHHMSEHRVVIRKARIGWRWVEQMKWTWGWEDRVYGAHWRPTEDCAERSTRRYARSQQPSADRIVSLNPEGETA